MRVSSIARSPRRTSCARRVERRGRRSAAARRSSPAPVAAQQRPQPRAQLLQRERLDEVVVGAGVEPAHAVGDARRARSASAPGVRSPAARRRRQTSSPSTLRHQHVEHDRVGRRGARARRAPRRRPRASCDVVAVEPQRALERVAHRRLVVDDEDPHADTMAREPERPIRPGLLRSSGAATLIVESRSPSGRRRTGDTASRWSEHEGRPRGNAHRRAPPTHGRARSTTVNDRPVAARCERFRTH